MPINVAVMVRCTSKNLMTGMIPPGGGAAADSVNVQCQLVVPTTGGTATSGSLNMMLPLASDTIELGAYYDLTMVDAAAPPAP